MLKKIEGGTMETIQGLDCWIPVRPDLKDIPGAFKDAYDMKWERTPIPDFDQSEVEILSDAGYPEGYRLTWNDAKREELIKQTGYDPWDEAKNPKPIYDNPDEFYVNEKMEAFRQQEFDRIENGYWFMCKGKPVYITGDYYFYLNWWKLNTGYPSFRDTDRQLFYFWEYVKNDKRAHGMLEITKRGQGKSYRVGCVAYLTAISFTNAHVGIQSKTDTDAESMFKTKIVEPYKELPEFLNPINNHGTEPQTELSFFPPARRSHASRFIKRQEAIRSKITFRSSKENAYDSETLKFLVQDEFAKVPPPNNAQKRLAINKDTVYRDSKMIGKIWCTTTVEDMRRGGDVCELVWNDSDLTQRSENGRTVSGLYPFFLSALDCSYFDVYGYPDVAKAKRIHDAERKNKKDSPNDLVLYIQQNPYTIQDAFRINGEDCMYDAMILTERERICTELKFTTRGDFRWVDGVKFGRSYFQENSVNGRWEVSWLFPNDSDSNQVEVYELPNGEKQYKPKNDHKFAQAYDPFSHGETTFEKRRSKAGSAVFRKYDFWDEDYSDTYVADYVHRTPNPEDAHEDILCAAFYFGCEVLCENNRNSFMDYCKRHGCADFIMMRPQATMPQTEKAKPTEGVPGSTLVIGLYVSRGQTHITRAGHKLKHLRIIKDYMKFAPELRTKLDLGVAAQLALLAAERSARDGGRQPNEEDVPMDAQSIYG